MPFPPMEEENSRQSPWQLSLMSKIPLSIKCKGRKLGLKSVTSKLIYEELLAGIQTTPSAKMFQEQIQIK